MLSKESQITEFPEPANVYFVFQQHKFPTLYFNCLSCSEFIYQIMIDALLGVENELN